VGDLARLADYSDAHPHSQAALLQCSLIQIPLWWSANFNIFRALVYTISVRVRQCHYVAFSLNTPIIGGDQAGLTISHQLSRRGLPDAVLE
jgi:hypothetical protein